MSVALFVRLKRPVPLVEIESASVAGLQELLNLVHKPFVSARFDQSDRMGSPSSELLTDSSKRLVCSLGGHQEKASVTPLSVPMQVPTNDGAVSFADQHYVSIKVYCQKTPLCWALVGAVAVGLARNQNAEIEDNAGFFIRGNVQGPDEFCRTLRVRTPHSNMELAAAELYANMPKSAEVAEWLESQATSQASTQELLADNDRRSYSGSATNCRAKTALNRRRKR
jgi:hypothetical protein